MPNELRGSLRGYRLSAHAARRIQQRGFDLEDLERIADNGKAFSADRGLLALRIPDSPFIALSSDDRLIHIAGGVVILDPWRRVVVTIYLSYGDERQPLVRKVI